MTYIHNVTDSTIFDSGGLGSEDENDVDSFAIKVEKTVFTVCVSLMSLSAIPPNVLIMVLALTNLGVTDKSRKGARSLERDGESKSLFVNKCVAHLLVCMTSPMDDVFIQQGGSDPVFCLTYLAIKSALLLYSVLAVALMGLDKLQRVYYIKKPFQRVKVKVKVAAMLVTVSLSLIPIMLHLALTSPDLASLYCYVPSAVVDVAEVIFLLGIVIIVASLIGMVVLLRKHGRRISDKIGLGNGNTKCSASGGNNHVPAIPTVSSMTMETRRTGEAAAESGYDVSETSCVDKSPCCFSPETEETDVATRKVHSSESFDKSSCSKDNNRQRQILSVPTQSEVVHVNQKESGTSSKATVFSVERQVLFQPQTTSMLSIVSCLPPVPSGDYQNRSNSSSNGNATNSSGARNKRPNPQYYNKHGTPLSPILEKRVRLCDANVDDESLQRPQDGPRTVCMTSPGPGMELHSVSGSTENQVRPSPSAATGSHARDNRNRKSVSGASSKLTVNRLKSATITAAKRGVLMMSILLVCYLPLMIGILVLTLQDVLYETVLLVEGMTLPMSYLHALLDPVLAIRANPAWRQRACAILRCVHLTNGKKNSVTDLRI